MSKKYHKRGSDSLTWMVTKMGKSLFGMFIVALLCIYTWLSHLFEWYRDYVYMFEGFMLVWVMNTGVVYVWVSQLHVPWPDHRCCVYRHRFYIYPCLTHKTKELHTCRLLIYKKLCNVVFIIGILHRYHSLIFMYDKSIYQPYFILKQ